MIFFFLQKNYKSYALNFPMMTTHNEKYIPCINSMHVIKTIYSYLTVEPPSEAITVSTLRGTLSTSVYMTYSGIFLHLALKRHVSSFTNFGGLLHLLIRRSNSSQRFSIECKSGLCAGQSSRFTPLSSY